MIAPLTARVSDRDAEIADAKAAELDRAEHGVTGPLFTVPDHGPTAGMLPQDRAAVGIALTLGPGLWDLDETRLLRVIYATARCHRWNGEGAPSLHVGAVMLGGEIAARYLHRRLTHEHGTAGFEALEAAIATLWPLPGETPPPVRGHAGMALHRLATGPLRALLSNSDVQAMNLLARGMPGGTDQATQLRCVARVCRLVLTDRSTLSAEDLTAVRNDVLARRQDLLPSDVQATDTMAQGMPGGIDQIT
ncbi:hypothetical protein ACFCZ6_13915 [Streptomyces hydrogenans]|uniref:hypothetical protein n=1 Tax=Streptomyces hydrogenans TaxID=1873719 RepID=UPI0035D925BA